jgi:3-oxoadipate enol-lactonase
MVEIGHGPPLVLVPGIQARWEWLRPGIEALAADFRVLTFTLAGDPASSRPFDPDVGFDNFTAQVDEALDEAGAEAAILCGVSYGGLIALRYAGLRPARVRALVLVSPLAPGWHPDRRVQFYSRAPLLLSPLFCAGACRRAFAELRATLPRWSDRVRFAADQIRRIGGAPMSPSRMAHRIGLLQGVDFTGPARRVTCPVLVVSGDERLDAVVPVEHTRTYAQVLPHAEFTQLENTGHLGLVTRPHLFAERVRAFLERHPSSCRPERRRATG